VMRGKTARVDGINPGKIRKSTPATPAMGMFSLDEQTPVWRWGTLQPRVGPDSMVVRPARRIFDSVAIVSTTERCWLSLPD